ncbi:MAG: hypothetical protein K5695_03100 [Oscillospiraceae bacterium]|nr:hypothetical protein [Oscillospiraceae bacterium]
MDHETNRSNLTPEQQAELSEMLRNMQQREQQQKDEPIFADHKSIPVLALLAAFLGTIPGIIIWTIVGSFGITWSLVGALIVAGALLAYSFACDRTGGEAFESLFGFIGVIVVCLIAVYLGVHFAWAGMISKVMREEGYPLSFGECAARLYELLGIMEIRGKFVGAVLKGYLFSIIGGIGLLSKVKK